MTRYLVQQTRVFFDDPIVIVDVGARWGYNEEWKVFGDCLRVYCFEPDAQECERLNASATRGVRYLPIALGRQNGKATLFEARLGASTGLYRTNMDFFSRLLNAANGETVAEHKIEVVTLDDAAQRFGIPSIDFLKLDVEGAELDVIVGGEMCVRSASLLGILSEFRFQEEINDGAIFWQLDAHVRQRGFRLFDLQYSHQSRRALPYQGFQDYRLPSGERFYAYTKHGQVMDGDALYFRDFGIPANRDLAAAAQPARILKLAALYEIYSLSDCAAELIVNNRERLEGQVDCDKLLDRLTPPLSGRKLGYRQYIEAYFDPKSANHVESTAAPSDAGAPSAGPITRALRAAARRFPGLRRL
jgi:FkbM family methyltransferase